MQKMSIQIHNSSLNNIIYDLQSLEIYQVIHNNDTFIRLLNNNKNKHLFEFDQKNNNLTKQKEYIDIKLPKKTLFKKINSLLFTINNANYQATSIK